MSDFPSFFADRPAWLNIGFGGQPMRAALVEINGLSTEDEWQKSKSKETSGAVAKFCGSTWGDPELTFECVDAAEERELRRLWDLLAPVPGQATATTQAPATSEAQTYGIGSPSKSGSSGSSTGGLGTGAAAGGDFKIPGNEQTKAPSVGPRPPTISVQYLPLLWHGITAVARKKWEGPIITETNAVRHKLTFIADKPPKPAGTGAMAPAKPDAAQYSLGGTGDGGSSGGSACSGATLVRNAANGAAGV